MGMKLSRKDLDAKIDEIIGKKRPRLSWCLYDSEDEEEGVNLDPDFDEDEAFENEILTLPFDSFDQIFHEGRVLFKHCGYWTDAKFVRKTNPTWRDVVRVAEKFAAGDHRFLEIISGPTVIEGGVVFDLGFGS